MKGEGFLKSENLFSITARSFCKRFTGITFMLIFVYSVGLTRCVSSCDMVKKLFERPSRTVQWHDQSWVRVPPVLVSLLCLLFHVGAQFHLWLNFCEQIHNPWNEVLMYRDFSATFRTVTFQTFFAIERNISVKWLYYIMPVVLMSYIFMCILLRRPTTTCVTSCVRTKDAGSPSNDCYT